MLWVLALAWFGGDKPPEQVEKQAGYPKGGTPWDLRGSCDVKPHCPFVTSADSFSQGREDLYMRHRYFCDVCSEPTEKKRAKLPLHAVDNAATQRTYVEIGALDGKLYSNTLMLEQKLAFGGVLIEGHPKNAMKLEHLRGVAGGLKQGKRGVNHVVKEAVCKGHGTVTYVGGEGGGTAGVMSEMSERYLATWHRRFVAAQNHTVTCRPIGEMIRGAGFDHVDLFSLDVEGAELAVLRTFDWRISVGVWLVEADGHNKAKDQEVRALLESHGYVHNGRRWMNEVYVPKAAAALVEQRRDYCKVCIEAGIDREEKRLRAAADHVATYKSTKVEE